MGSADHGQPVLRLDVPDRVPPGQQRARLSNLGSGGVEDGAHRLHRQLLRKRGDGEREQRPAAHGEDVVQRVRGRDRPEDGGIVDHGREEIGREDEGTLVVELVDGGVVRGRETHEEVLGGRRREAGKELLQASR
jgi:hypothetical protein